MVEPIRVLFVAAALPVGGAEKHLIRLIRRLDTERFEVAVAVVRGGGALERELPSDVPLMVLCSGWRWSVVAAALRSVRRLRKLIVERRPEVVCTLHDVTGVATLLALRRLDDAPRCVVSVQNAIWRKYRQARPTSRLLRGWMRRLYPRADRLVAPSAGVAAELTDWLACGPERVDVIYNAGPSAHPSPPWPPSPAHASHPPGRGGDLSPPAEAWRRTERAVSKKRPLMVACGRLIEQKGFDVLLEAFASVRRKIPAELWILGEGPQRSALERQIRRLGLDDDAWLSGVLPDPMEIMGKADLFVLSSRWEGLPTVVIEALASGAPVVATDCPHGPAEIIEDGVSGLLVPVEDVDQLASAIGRVLSDGDLARRLAAAGRERAQRFSSATVARRYGELFEKLCDESGR